MSKPSEQEADNYKANTAELTKLVSTEFRTRRKLVGATLEQVADRANLNRATYTKIDSGAQLPRLDVFIRICQVLYISPNAIIDKYEGDL